MSEMVAIVGNSGTGKTTSLRNLNPETTFIISVTGKSLHFPKAKKNYVAIQKDEKLKKYVGNYFVSSDSEKICNVLKMISVQMPHISTVVLDDFFRN